jgi:hypothetical protein
VAGALSVPGGGGMGKLNFTDDELREIVRVCALIQIDDCTPPYLQGFIALRLADDFPELSAKVRRLSPDEMDELCECIKAHPAPVP